MVIGRYLTFKSVRHPARYIAPTMGQRSQTEAKTGIDLPGFLKLILVLVIS